jgi:hypothetical protein
MYFMCASPRSHCYWQADEVGRPVLIDLRTDDGRFFNHSAKPNIALGSVLTATGLTAADGARSSYALRDIRPGEELLDDYNTYGARMPCLQRMECACVTLCF